MRIKYLIFAVISAITILGLTPVAPLSALTSVQIQEIADMLASFGAEQNLIDSVTDALNSNATGSQTWCHTFDDNLGWAQSGTDEIGHLHTALEKEKISYAPDTGNTYNTGTSNGVIAFQQKYNISPASGYVGPLTRATLTALYGCNSDLPDATGAEFTIVLLPSTQTLVSTSSQTWFDMAQWIADNKTKQNIKAVIGLGDMTENASFSQFSIASQGYEKIDKAGIPYMAVIGGNDYYGAGSRNAANFNSFFGPSRFYGKYWYSGYYSGSNENYYEEFTVGEYKFLLLGLEYYPRDEVLSWARMVISQHQDSNIILATNAFLKSDGTWYGSGEFGRPSDISINNSSYTGQKLWDDFIKAIPQIKMVVSSHFAGALHTVQRADTNLTGGTVNQLYINYESEQADSQGMHLPILKFNPDTHTAKLVVPVLGATGLTNSFDIAFNLEKPIGNLRITAPNGGEIWEIGKRYDISWNYSGIPNDHKLSAFIVDDAAGISIEAGGNVDISYGVYHWLITDIANIPPGNHYKIKILDNSNNQTYDLSDNYFTIIDSAACGQIFTDSRDNKKYPTVKIGDQCWMAKNFDYNNGCLQKTWIAGQDTGWCGYYPGQSSASGEGLLYQWSVAMSPNFCPAGWHLPSDAEWHELEMQLWDGTEDYVYGACDWDRGGYRGQKNSIHEFGLPIGCAGAGAKLKEAGNVHWNLLGHNYPPLVAGQNLGGDNSSGFTAIPAGMRMAWIGGDPYLNNYFFARGWQGAWWSSDRYERIFDFGTIGSYDTNLAWTRKLVSNNSFIGRNFDSKYNAFSVRCVKDSGTYIKISSPKDRDVFAKDQTMNITWQTSSVPSGHRVNIVLLDETKAKMFAVGSNIPVLLNSFNWKIPSTIPEGTHYKLIIADAQDNKISYITSGYFSIIR